MRTALTRTKAILSLLNQEPYDVILKLPGIGPKTADKLLALRQACLQEGRLMRIKDVAFGVKGIGPSLVAKLTGDESAATVIKYAALCQQYFCYDELQPPSTLLSLDLGIHNSAYVLIDDQYLVRDWKKLELGMPSPYSPGKCFSEVEKSIKLFPTADLYIVEEQSHRNPSKKGFLNISVELRSLEAMVFAISKLTKQVPMFTLQASRVAKYFGINNTKSAVKKKLAIELVRSMVDSNNPVRTPLGSKLQVSQELLKYFNGEAKKDDLSDCLLQAIAVMDWYKMAQEL